MGLVIVSKKDLFNFKDASKDKDLVSIEKRCGIITGRLPYLGKLINCFFYLLACYSSYALPAIAQTNPALEFREGDGNPTTNGPVTSTTIRFRNNTDNPTGSTIVTYSPAFTANFSLSNQQYLNHAQNTNGNSNNSNNPASVIGWFFGGGSTGLPDPIFPLLNLVGSPSNSNFTSLPNDALGTGIRIDRNRGILIANGVSVLNGKIFNSKYHMVDLRVNFNLPISNPVLHISGLGANFSNGGSTVGFSVELELLSPGVTMSKLSGSGALGISGNHILNLAAKPLGSGPDAASGSILLEGENISTLNFKVYVRGESGISGTNWGSTSVEDGWVMGFSAAMSDLQIIKTVNNPEPEIGTNVSFDITANNLGASNQTGVSVEEILPSGYAYVSHSAPSGTSYNPVTGIWDIGNLSNGNSRTLNLVATVLDVENYTNTVNIRGDISDPNSGNNTASVTTEPFRILPVHWLYFKGLHQEGRVRLEWATAQEKNNHRFILQRSRDSKKWDPIGQVNGMGNTEIVSSYLHWDENPELGSNYYRLVQVDSNGSNTYSQVIQVAFNPEWDVRIFPNPFIEEIQLYAKELSGAVITLMDLKGSVVRLELNEKNESSMKFGTGKLAKGVYFLSIRYPDKIIVKKLMKL